MQSIISIIHYNSIGIDISLISINIYHYLEECLWLFYLVLGCCDVITIACHVISWFWDVLDASFFGRSIHFMEIYFDISRKTLRMNNNVCVLYTIHFGHIIYELYIYRCIYIYIYIYNIYNIYIYICMCVYYPEAPMYSLYDYIQLRTNYLEHWLSNYIRTQKSSTFKSIETRDIRGSRFETKSSRNSWHSRLSIRDWRSSQSS